MCLKQKGNEWVLCNNTKWYYYISINWWWGKHFWGIMCLTDFENCFSKLKNETPTDQVPDSAYLWALWQDRFSVIFVVWIPFSSNHKGQDLEKESNCIYSLHGVQQFSFSFVVEICTVCAGNESTPKAVYRIRLQP